MSPTQRNGESSERAYDLGVSDRLYRFLRSLVRAVNRRYWKVRVTGKDNVPADGPVILAPVHRNFFDFFVVSEVTDRKIYYMAKEELWKTKPLGKLLESIGAFPVDREGADRLALDRAQSVLARGDILILFPEGTRRTGPEVTDLQEGAAFLAARTGAPVVPIGIGGSTKISPPGKKLPRPASVNLLVGSAVAPPPRTGKGRVPRSQVHEMTLHIGEQLQKLYAEAEAESAGR